MPKLHAHFRTVFLAGVLAAIPVAVTVFVVVQVEQATREAAASVLRMNVPPFVGVALAIALVYLLGVFVTSVIGRVLLRLLDRTLDRVPMLRELYAAWKHVSLTPGGGEGMFAKVVLVPPEGSTGPGLTLGFTSGEPIAGMPGHLPVFVAQCPNPMNGRLLIVPAEFVRPTDLSPEEAFKVLLSTGNYLPKGIAPNIVASEKDEGMLE